MNRGRLAAALDLSEDKEFQVWITGEEQTKEYTFQFIMDFVGAKSENDFDDCGRAGFEFVSLMRDYDKRNV